MIMILNNSFVGRELDMFVYKLLHLSQFESVFLEDTQQNETILFIETTKHVELEQQILSENIKKIHHKVMTTMKYIKRNMKYDTTRRTAGKKIMKTRPYDGSTSNFRLNSGNSAEI